MHPGDLRIGTGILLRHGQSIRGELATVEELGEFMQDNDPEAYAIFQRNPTTGLTVWSMRLAQSRGWSQNSLHDIGRRHEQEHQREAAEVERSRVAGKLPAEERLQRIENLLEQQFHKPAPIPDARSVEEGVANYNRAMRERGQ